MTVQTKLKAVLVGCGKVGAHYAEDPIMARYYPYATHAQVLASHPDFSWKAIVDLSNDTLKDVQRRWDIPYAAQKVEELPPEFTPDVAILATPPGNRLEIIKKLPSLKAVLVEKPLGISLEESLAFINNCDNLSLKVQVNYWRRADSTFRDLASGRLIELIGKPQVVFGLYGNGIFNNCSHLIDYVRMLLGEVETVQAVSGAISISSGPITDDLSIPFTINLTNGIKVMFQPLDFSYYRENGLDIWGERGRLSILQEGLGIFHYPVGPNRSSQGDQEVASDSFTVLQSTVGNALYNVYTNLANAIIGKDELWSPGCSALHTAIVLQSILESWRTGGKTIHIPQDIDKEYQVHGVL